MRLLQYATTNYYTRSRKSKWPEVFAKFQVRWAIITATSTFLDWIQVYAEKLVNAPESRNSVLCANAHNSGNYETRLKCLQDWSRLGLVSALSRLCLDYALASISCEHCRSSRNNPHYAPRHIIYYWFVKHVEFFYNFSPIQKWMISDYDKNFYFHSI